MALCGETAIVTSNMEGIIQSVDKGCCTMFGYEMHELPGKPLKILVPTPYKEQHDSYMENYHKTGKAKIIGRVRMLEGQHKDGTVFPIRLSVSVVKTGPTSIYIGMIQKLQDTAAIITADMNGKIISVNQYCESIWGYSTNELIGENVRILMPNPHRDKHDSYLENYFKTGKMKVIGKVRNVPAQHKNGIIFPVCLQVQRLRINDTDYFRGRIERVDEEKEAVFTLNCSGIILSCNGHFVLPLLGYTDEELKGKHINILMPKLYNDNDKVLTKRKREHDDKEISKLQKISDDIEIQNETVNIESIQNNNNNNNNNNNDKTNESTRKDDEIIYILPKEIQQPVTVEEHFNKIEKGKFPVSRGGCPIFHGNTEYINFDTMESDIQAENFAQFNSEKSLEQWSLGGTRFIECVHKDGSCFTVALTITKFLSDGSIRYSGKVKRLIKENANEAEKEPDHCQLAIGKYLFATQNSIGSGSYGKVFLGCNSEENNNKVAVKILQKDIMDEVELERARREIEIMKQLHHPNICRLYESFESTDRLYIVMEYCANGELFAYVNSRGTLPENVARDFFVQILSGINYCHNKSVIHRDIKHKNILLDENFNIKVIDFGLSNFTINGGFRNTFCGTPAYSAPEMILAQQYVGPEVDVWSMGVVLYSMLTGEFPFKTVSDIINGQFKIPSDISPNCTDAISKMLTVDSKDRITVSNLLEHPFITNKTTEPIPTSEIKQIQCVVLP